MSSCISAHRNMSICSLRIRYRFCPVFSCPANEQECRSTSRTEPFDTLGDIGAAIVASALTTRKRTQADRFSGASALRRRSRTVVYFNSPRISPLANFVFIAAACSINAIPCAVTVWPASVTTNGHTRWLARVRKPENKYPLLVCVLDRENRHIERIFLSPPVGRAGWQVKTEHDRWFREQIRIQSGDQFCSELVKIARQHSLPSSVFVPKTVGGLKAKQ